MAKFKKLLLVVFLLATSIFPNMAIAEEGMILKRFQVDIWPEYDDPRVLVIYQGTFINNGNSDFSGYVEPSLPKETQQQSTATKAEAKPLAKTEARKNPIIYITLALFVLILMAFIIFALLKDKRDRKMKSQNTNSQLIMKRRS